MDNKKLPWLRSGVAVFGRFGFRAASRRALVVIAAVTLPGVAYAAALKGQVGDTSTLLNPAWTDAKDPGSHRYSFREPSPTVPSGLRQLTAYLPHELAIVALADGAKPKGDLKVSVIGGRTVPAMIVVPAGQTIEFTNRDPFIHRLYSLTDKGLPKSELRVDKATSWTPPGPGSYEIRDEQAPSLRTWVVVEPRAVAVGYPTRQGAFTLDLEPGDYTIVAYFKGERVGKEQPISVGATTGEQILKEPLIAAAPAAKKDQ